MKTFLDRYYVSSFFYDKKQDLNVRHCISHQTHRKLRGTQKKRAVGWNIRGVAIPRVQKTGGSHFLWIGFRAEFGRCTL